jgi:hypothetical protein
MSHLLIADGSVRTWLQSADDRHGRSVRLDSRQSVPGLTAARIAARAWAADLATQAPADRREDVTSELVRAVGHGLGWRADASEVRCDSWYGPGALTVEADLVRPAYAIRRLSEVIPTRTVPSWAEYVPGGAIAHRGSVALYRPGMTDIPRADIDYSERQVRVHTFVARTGNDWQSLLQAPRADFSVVAEQAEAVRQTFATWKEEALIAGVAGTSFAGLQQIGVPRYTSTIDYGSGSTTLDQIYRDIVALIQTPEIEAGDRGNPPDTLLIGTRWHRAIQRASGFSTGSGATGSDILAMLQRVGPGLAGIARIVPAPSLSRWQGSATVDAALTLDSRDVTSLRQIEAMAPAPVRTASTLTSDEQMWACRHAGLDVGSALPLTLATATVA